MGNEITTERATRSSLASSMQSGGGGVVSFVPNSFDGLLQVADLMARSGSAIPKHLRGNPGACLSVAMTAYQNGFNPFLLAADTYVVSDILSWGAKSVAAMVNNSSHLQGRLAIEFSGTWPARSCTVTGRVVGDPDPKSFTTHAQTITTRNSPNWKQQPDLQLAYVAQRNWARVYMSEVTLGLIDSDEAASIGQPEPAAPPPPRPTIKASPVIEVDVRPAPEPDCPVAETFEFVTADGEVLDYDGPDGFYGALSDALSDAADDAQVEGLWESNASEFNRLPDDLKEEGRTAYKNAQARIMAFKRSRAMPGLSELPIAVTTIEVPVKENGVKDYRAFLTEIGSRLNDATSIDEFEAWQRENAEELASAKIAMPRGYKSLEDLIAKRSVDFLGGENV